MRHLAVWIVELLKLLGGQRLHPLTTQCPVCNQLVHLHVNKAGRRHALGHAQALYEGARFSVHYAAAVRCDASGRSKLFDPRPNEHAHFKPPNALYEE
jgi:hypothetical protein